METKLRDDQAPDTGWLTRENVLGLVLVAGSGCVFGLCFMLAQPFLPGIAFGTTLALMLRRPHRALRGQLSANAAATLGTLLGAALILAPLWFVGDRLVSEGTELVQQVYREGSLKAFDASLESSSAGAARWVGKTFDLNTEAGKLGRSVTSQAPTLVAAGVWLGGQFLLTLIVCFYLLRDRTKLLEALRHLLPLSDREFDEVKLHLVGTVHATVVGSLSMAAVQGTLGGIAFFLLGLPAPVVWGAVMGLLAVVPMLGTFVVWMPAAIMLGCQGEVVKAAVLVAWGLFAIGMIDNVLYPIVVGKEMRLHALLVLIALLGGIAVFGAAGLVIGPVILSLAAVLIDIWRRRTRGGRAAENAPGSAPRSPG